MRSFFLLWAMCFALLFPCLFSFPHNVLPDIGLYVGRLLDVPLNWIGCNLFGLTEQQASLRISDSRGLYVLALLSAIMAIIPALIFYFKDKTDKALPVMKIILRYYLGWNLLLYGCAKLFKSQFYLPEPNLLFTTLGELNKDMLYWSTMGVSRSYNMMTGAMEVLATGLLFFRRSAFAGAFLSALILANIVAINFSYDISVKLFSSFLLLISIALLLTEFSRLKSFFSGKAFQASEPALTEREKLLRSILKPVLLLLIFADALYNYTAFGSFNDDTVPRPELHGAYNVEYHEADSSGLDWKRAFYHRHDYFIIQYNDDSMDDYDAAYEREKKSLSIFRDSNEVFVFKCVKSGTDIQLKGEFKGKEVNVLLRRIPLDSLPLLRPEFNLFID